MIHTFVHDILTDGGHGVGIFIHSPESFIHKSSSFTHATPHLWMNSNSSVSVCTIINYHLLHLGKSKNTHIVQVQDSYLLPHCNLLFVKKNGGWNDSQNNSSNGQEWGIYHISRTIRRTMIFSLDILEKDNDECILILVIYWKKTGLVHTKISNHNIIYSS